jgi:hypothetical protein
MNKGLSFVMKKKYGDLMGKFGRLFSSAKGSEKLVWSNKGSWRLNLSLSASIGTCMTI